MCRSPTALRVCCPRLLCSRPLSEPGSSLGPKKSRNSRETHPLTRLSSAPKCPDSGFILPPLQSGPAGLCSSRIRHRRNGVCSAFHTVCKRSAGTLGSAWTHDACVNASSKSFSLVPALSCPPCARLARNRLIYSCSPGSMLKSSNAPQRRSLP